MFSVFQLEGKVQQGERDFEQISKTIRKEVSRFEVRTIDRCLRGAGISSEYAAVSSCVSLNRRKE